MEKVFSKIVEVNIYFINILKLKKHLKNELLNKIFNTHKYIK